MTRFLIEMNTGKLTEDQLVYCIYSPDEKLGRDFQVTGIGAKGGGPGMAIPWFALTCDHVLQQFQHPGESLMLFPCYFGDRVFVK